MATDLKDAITRHQILLQRYAGRNVQAMLPFIRRLAADIERRLATENLTEFQTARLQATYADLAQMIGQTREQIETRLGATLEELAHYEMGFTARMLEGAATVKFAVPSADQIAAIVSRTPMTLVMGKTVEQITMREMFQTFANAAFDDVRQTVQAGIVEGKPTREIARDVKQMVTNRTRRQAEAVVRTATNHVATVARSAVYEENSDIIEAEVFVATLDDRTTVVCAGYDGNEYPIGVGPMPPIHFSCRSARAPVLKEKYRIPTKGQRASFEGPVSKNVTYSGWLRDQGADFQDEVLGPERAKLFRDGEVTLDRFVDDRGILYTLDQLRAREGLVLN